MILNSRGTNSDQNTTIMCWVYWLVIILLSLCLDWLWAFHCLIWMDRQLLLPFRFKFDDERVTKEDIKRALEEQYGGEEELPQTNPGFNNNPFKFKKYENAYMLVYIRESDKEKIVCNVDEKDITEHLKIRLKKEQEEKEDKRRYKAQAHLYTIIKVARDEDLVEQIGKDIYFDLVDHERFHSFRIQKQMPFNLFKVPSGSFKLFETCC
ncbi:Ubiquitin carboxyl-terminal hydrolase 12 [Camellia lanceoleosa]|uniref:Ubiquitin carboxyl-terminal hydrolase 12 n=1 Tax=Camellia lanceoleosa TaxID=1840588 RepID=A0ACC0GDL0_9ERIC|nr:Ubiquitin carboxyl-terminal hydrolase 12 [Camellia lanceoleosa]